MTEHHIQQLSVGASILLSSSPLDYSKVRFDAVDILYVSPFCVQKDKTFNFEGDAKALLPIFQNVVKTARGLNPHISIVVMQMWSGGTTIDELQTDHDIETYANSVVQFIVNHSVDGYDNDYESGNVCEQAGKVLSAIHQKLHKVRATPPYHVSVAPSTSEFLDDKLVKSSLNYVSMQNYSGGSSQTIDEYKKIFHGTHVNIIFGINSETSGENWPDVGSSTNVIDTVYDIVTKNGLNGIYNWRLDSGDWVFQNALQVYLYNKFHGKSLKCPFTLQEVIKAWPDVNGGPIPPFQ